MWRDNPPEVSEDEPGVDKSAPGAEVLDFNDGMDEVDEIRFQIRDSSWIFYLQSEHRKQFF